MVSMKGIVVIYQGRNLTEDFARSDSEGGQR
jgi:hypothetical protein